MKYNNPRLTISPAALSFLIHCYCIRSEFERINAPVTQETIKWFLEDEIIEPIEGEVNQWQCTDKGVAWMDAICGTPIPEKKWIVDYTKALDTKGE